jgi:hypothetical protein
LVVLFLVFGSSCSGKTSVLRELRGRVDRLAVHDFDELGVPPHATIDWRHSGNEIWLRRALEYEHEGTDLLLAGQTPLGEMLASPSATLVESISACLLDCDDETRLERMQARGARWLKHSAGTIQDYLNWAEWMRRHVADPQWMPEVIVRGDADLRWERWTDWQAGDPRWRVHAVDTTGRSVEQTAADLRAWIEAERAGLA